MSTQKILAGLYLTAVAGSLVALVALVAVALGSGDGADDVPDEELESYFLRDAAAMQAMGLPVYWLGTEFTVDDAEFQGPHVYGGRTEVQGGGISMSYLRANASLRLTVYSRTAWDLVRDTMMSPPLRGVTRKTVSVGGREGELVFIPSDTRPLSMLRLILDLGDVVVVAATGAGGATYPGGPDYNPFINKPDLLIEVMEDLRRYRE